MFDRGDRVNTPLGPGTVAYRRMEPPDYREPAAYSVTLDSREVDLIWGKYSGTIFPAEKVLALDV